MYIPDIQDLVFARNFRWTVESDDLASHYVSSISVNKFKKLIKLSLYDAYSLNESQLSSIKWINSIDNKNILLTLYDGCSNALHKVRFNGLQLMSHRYDLDYNAEGPLLRKIVLKYETEEDIYQTVKPLDAYRKENQDQKAVTHSIKICDMNDNIILQDNDFDLDGRPEVEFKEFEMRFCHSTTHMPDKPTWLPFKVKVNGKAAKSGFLSHCTSEGRVNVTIESNFIKENVKETWLLTNAYISHIDFDKPLPLQSTTMLNLIIEYNQVNWNQEK